MIKCSSIEKKPRHLEDEFELRLLPNMLALYGHKLPTHPTFREATFSDAICFLLAESATNLQTALPHHLL